MPGTGRRRCNSASTRSSTLPSTAGWWTCGYERAATAAGVRPLIGQKPATGNFAGWWTCGYERAATAAGVRPLIGQKPATGNFATLSRCAWSCS
jgi:hypothetical protein